MTTNDHTPDNEQFGSAGSPDSRSGFGGVMDRAEDKVKEAGQEAVNAIDSRRTSAADSLSGMANRLHTGAVKAADLGHKGGEKLSHLAHTAADKLQSGAEYVREHDFKDLMHSVENFVRRHPGQALVAAGVVGFLAARSMRND
jgi:ElaB/YqjD/DUF883 family membrane-anchored ribosome-binding protein